MMHTEVSPSPTRWTSIGMAHGNVARIQNGRGALLCVQYGAVWITQSGSTADVCLEAGESLRIDSDGLTLVSPVGPAPLALVTLAPLIRIAPSLAKRMATGFRSRWADRYRMPSPSSTSRI